MLSSSLWFTLLLLTYLHGDVRAQMVSYGMRRLALSTNQFGLDLLRAMERTGRDSPYSVRGSAEGSNGGRQSYAFCPFCIGASLAMLMTGLAYTPRQGIVEEATESAYESLRYALYLNNMQPQEINLAYLDLMRHLQVNLPDGFRSRRSTGLSEESLSLNPLSSQLPNLMRITNQMYVQRHLPVDYHYYVLTQHYYCTPMRSLELAYAGEESRQHINAVVEQATAGKVPHLLPTGINSLSHAKLLLLSAMYLEGKLDLRQAKSRSALHALWPYRRPLQQYQQQGPHPMVHVHGQQHVNRSTVRPHLSTTSTVPPSMSSAMPGSFTTTSPNNGFNPFKPLRNSSTLVTKESIRLRYTRSTYLNATVVEMPLVGGILTMLALVPESPSAIELMLSRINAQLVVDLMQNLEIRRVDIMIPVINASYAMPNLRQVLTRMGLGKLFKPSESLLGESSEPSLFTFAGIEGFPLSQVMYLQHQTVLDLSVEDHTEQHPWEESHSRTARHLNHKQDSYLPTVTSPILRIVPSITSDGREKKLGLHSKAPMGGIINSKQRPATMAGNKPNQRRTYISLEDEFLYLVVDNISGLILTMGIYRS